MAADPEYAGSWRRSEMEGDVPAPTLIQNAPSAEDERITVGTSEAKQVRRQPLFTAQCRKVSGYVALAVFVVVSSTMFIGGTIHVRDCPVDSRIPIWLLVFGFAWLATIICIVLWINFPMWKRFVGTSAEESAQQGRRSITRVEATLLLAVCLLYMFMTVLLVCGWVWIFGVSDRVQQERPEEETYCNGFTYELAKIVAIGIPTVICSLLAFIIALGVMCCCFADWFIHEFFGDHFWARIFNLDNFRLFGK